MTDTLPADRARIGAILAEMSEGWEDLDAFEFQGRHIQPAAFAAACEALRVRFEAPEEPADTRAITDALAKLLADASVSGDFVVATIRAGLSHLHRLSSQVEMIGLLLAAMRA